jgi:2,3-bisphosphoglycerate-independent phosphoglycerate mutase
MATTGIRPVLLLILDGLGVDVPNEGNAVTLAKTPNLDSLWPRYPHTYLNASSNYVGLPNGVTGNSEVGHMSIGAGRVVYQEIAKIDDEIATKKFFENEMLKKILGHLGDTGGRLHLMGLVSDGRVHSSMDHLFACLEFCRLNNFPGDRVFVHAFTDGRDTPPQNAEKYFLQLESEMNLKKMGTLASMVGRYYAMDRDNRWERTQAAYDLITSGKGTKVESFREALYNSYKENITDEYIKPYVIARNGEPVGAMRDGDAVLYFNYRADRAVQLSKVFEDAEFEHFQRMSFQNLLFVGFSNYEKGIPMNRAEEDITTHGDERKMVTDLFQDEQKKTGQFPKYQLFPPERIEYSLGQILADKGLKQLRLSESEKYPHVTYFFSGRHGGALPNETRIEIPSPKDIATYDLKPEMSTYEITDTCIAEIGKNQHDFLFVNFALTDMVAHTGNLQASIKAVEVADECTAKLVRAFTEAGGVVIITADHGNIEELINLQTGQPDTKHSTNQVPIIIVGKDYQPQELGVGMLADLAPTVLSIMGVQIPETMTGRKLI